MTSFPWGPGTATGVGSLPGRDPAEALRTVLDGLPELPHLPELPARGPGADLTGRTAGLLVEMPVHLEPSGWRFADRPGRDTRRSLDHLARDLDAMEELAEGHDGPFKIQVCGPWTLAATIELRHGERALKDLGAVRDLTESLAEGLAGHVADVRRRLPAARILVQIDEPSLPSVLAGRVPTASGFSRLAAIEAPLAGHLLGRVVEAAGEAYTIVHCCGAEVPFRLLREAGAGAVSFDLGVLHRREEDALGESIDAGVGLLAGAVPATATGTGVPSLEATAAPLRELWRRLGFPAVRLAAQTVITPACGLAGASPRYARQALKHCGETARMLYETAG